MDHQLTKNLPKLKLRPGDIVEVRSFAEISTTLGDDGAMAGLPFQPEMRRYCRQTFRVLRPIKKLIIENANTGLRGIKDSVLLEGSNCDGQFHQRCTRYCFFIWKKAWLKKAGTRQQPANPNFARNQCTADQAFQVESLLNRRCQSMALVEATYPLSIWDINQYFWDISDSALPFLKRIVLLSISLARHIKNVFKIQLPNKLGSQLDKTPSIDFNLEPGDLVEIKSMEEIKTTLDSSGKNRGLGFTKEMKKFCGQKFAVLRPIDQTIIEGIGEIRRLSNTVILKGATCDGQPHFGCARSCYLMWRKIWLKKI